MKKLLLLIIFIPLLIQAQVVVVDSNASGITSTNRLLEKAAFPVVAGSFSFDVVDTAKQVVSYNCKRATFTIDYGYSGTVYLGTSNTLTTSNGIQLKAGDAITLFLSNTNLIWYRGSTAGSKIVRVIYEN